MKLENLYKVTKLQKKLKEIDKELSCISESDREASIKISIGDHCCGTSWFSSKELSGNKRAKILSTVKDSLNEIRQKIIKELKDLGVEP